MLSLAACHGSDALAPVDRTFLAGALRFTAIANGTDGGRNIDCQVDGLLNIDPTPVRRGPATVYTGTGGGGAYRSVLADDGTGTAVYANYYQAMIEIRLIGSDSIEVRDVTPYPDAGTSRFWDAMRFFAGTVRITSVGQGLAHGHWACPPLDTPGSSGGYADVEGTVEGSWIIPDPNNR
jgi:hypothetical protein